VNTSVVTVLDRQNSVGFGRYYGKKTAVSVSVLRTVIELLKLSYNKFYNNGAYSLPLPVVKIRGLTRMQILGSADPRISDGLFVTAVGDSASN